MSDAQSSVRRGMERMAQEQEKERAIARILADPKVQSILQKMSENPSPKAVCPKCWFELRTTGEIEEHICPPEPREKGATWGSTYVSD